MIDFHEASANLVLQGEDSERRLPQPSLLLISNEPKQVLPTRASALTEEPMQPDPTALAHIQRQTLTYKFRLRDKHAAELNRQARAVNYVWNFVNEVAA